MFYNMIDAYFGQIEEEKKKTKEMISPCWLKNKNASINRIDTMINQMCLHCIFF